MPRTRGSRSFRRPDIDQLLSIVAEVLPRDRSGWEEVTRVFNRDRDASAERTAASLKSKFRLLGKQRDSTGNPHSGEHQSHARMLERQIHASMPSEGIDNNTPTDRGDADPTPEPPVPVSTDEEASQRSALAPAPSRHQRRDPLEELVGPLTSLAKTLLAPPAPPPQTTTLHTDVAHLIRLVTMLFSEVQELNRGMSRLREDVAHLREQVTVSHGSPRPDDSPAPNE